MFALEKHKINVGNFHVFSMFHINTYDFGYFIFFIYMRLQEKIEPLDS